MSTNMVSMADILAAQKAAIASAVEVPKDRSIKISDDETSFVIPGGAITQSPELDVVVVAFANRKQRYVGRFNKKNPKPPVCFALGMMKHKEMKPHLEAPQPGTDADGELVPNCASCMHNDWDLERTCTDNVWLAVLPPDSPQEELALVKISQTGIRHWNKFASNLAETFDKMPIEAIATLKIVKAGNSKGKTIAVTLKGLNEDATAFGARFEEAQKMVLRVPDLDS